MTIEKEGSPDLWTSRLKPLLEGKAEAPNRFVKYMADKVIELREERANLIRELSQIEKKGQEVAHRLAQVEAANDASIFDIQKWWDGEPKEEKEEN